MQLTYKFLDEDKPTLIMNKYAMRFHSCRGQYQVPFDCWYTFIDQFLTELDFKLCQKWR